MGVWYNGIMTVSKTKDRGPIPLAPALGRCRSGHNGAVLKTVVPVKWPVGSNPTLPAHLSL